MLHAAFLRSDIARGTMRSIDVSAARDAARCGRRVHRRGSERCRRRELGRLRGARRRDPSLPTPGRGRRALRRRADRPGDRRVALHRRGRLRAHRHRHRSGRAGHRRRCRRRPGRRRRPPRIGRQRGRRHSRGRRSRRSTRSSRRPPTSSPRPSPSTATSACRWRPAASCRLGPGAARAHGVDLDAGSARRARLPRSGSRPGRASHPSHHGRRRRWLRPEDVHAARRGGRRRSPASASADRSSGSRTGGRTSCRASTRATTA